MPRKLRELRRDLRQVGYTQVKGAGKGSHQKWRHPLVGQTVNLSGHDGNDAKPYQEDAVREAIERAKEAERKRQPMSAERLDYSMVIEWSPEDQAYLVTLPEWAESVRQPVTHGETYEEAARNGREVLEMLMESAREEGETIPAPRTRATSAP